MTSQFLRLFKMAVAFAVITICTTMPALSQPGGNRVAFGTHFGLSKYWGTFTDNQFWLGGDIFLRWNIIPQLSLHGVFGLSQLRIKVNEQNIRDHPEYFGAFGSGVGTGTYPNSNPPLNREEINTVRVNTYAMLASFNVFANQNFVPYLFGGVGAINFEPRNKNQNLPLPNNRDAVYDKTVMVIPFGAGVEWYLTSDFVLNAKAQMHLASTDYLDDLAEPEQATTPSPTSLSASATISSARSIATRMV